MSEFLCSNFQQLKTSGSAFSLPVFTPVPTYLCSAVEVVWLAQNFRHSSIRVWLYPEPSPDSRQ